ncbi:MAG: hypothetical protein ACE149_12830 [Armatimonadota bacterium]
MNQREAVGLLLTFARRGEEELIRQSVSAIRQRGAATVLAVGTGVSAPVLRRAGADEVLLYGDGLSAWEVIRELRRRSPQEAVVVYLDPTFAGHLKLEGLALFSGARRLWRAAPGASAAATSRAALAASVLVKAARTCACVLAGASICATAFVFLRVWQLAAGGGRANRA